MAQLSTLGRTTLMDMSHTFLVKAVMAFLYPVVLSAICYFVASSIARLFSSTSRGFYIRRLVWMFVAVVLWWLLYPYFHDYVFIGNGADPRNEERHAWWVARQLGWSYGIHAIWAWLFIALIDRPKVRPNKSPEPTAVGAGRSAVAVHVTSRRWLSFFRWATRYF